VLAAPGDPACCITPPFVTVMEMVKFSGPEKTQEILAIWQAVTFIGPLSVKFDEEPLLCALADCVVGDGMFKTVVEEEVGIGEGGGEDVNEETTVVVVVAGADALPADSPAPCLAWANNATNKSVYTRQIMPMYSMRGRAGSFQRSMRSA